MTRPLRGQSSTDGQTVTIAWRWMWHYLGYVIGGGAALLLFLAGLICLFGFLYWIGTLGDDDPEVHGG